MSLENLAEDFKAVRAPMALEDAVVARFRRVSRPATPSWIPISVCAAFVLAAVALYPILYTPPPAQGMSLMQIRIPSLALVAAPEAPASLGALSLSSRGLTMVGIRQPRLPSEKTD